ncbi:hypothetical protein KKA00_10695 [bacterium]|nr:hypothetical protein [bacterium]MBU1652679.1 hypothetical protein [bacterium]
MMNVRCEDFEREHAEFKTGKLDTERSEALAAHQRQCSHCATYSAGLHEVRQMLQKLPQLESSPYFESDLQREINSLKHGGNSKQQASGVPRFLALASGFAVAIIVSFVILQPAEQPTTIDASRGVMAEEQTLEKKSVPNSARMITNELAEELMLAYEGPVDTAIHRLPEPAGQDSIPIPNDYWKLDQVSTTPGDN